MYTETFNQRLSVLDQNIKNIQWRLLATESLYFIAAFTVILTVAKCGQYLNFAFEISPAWLWPAAGIAFALIWLWGYYTAMSIFLALVVATLTAPEGYTYPIVFLMPLGQVGGFVLGVYLLRRFEFDDSFAQMRDVVLLFSVMTFTGFLVSTLITILSVFFSSITAPSILTWFRLWTGHTLSLVILFPALISWIKFSYLQIKQPWYELLAAFSLLLLSLYLFYYLNLTTEAIFAALTLFFFAHLWVSLRFSIQLMTFSLFVTFVGGITAILASVESVTILNSQLTAFGLFMFLVIPISYAFAVIVKERDTFIQHLQNAMDRISRENVLKNDFVAVLAHELRNPLAPVKTILEVLELQSTDVESKKMIQTAYKQIHSMGRLLDDLLDIARVTQGKFKLQLQRVNLCELLQAAIETTKVTFIEHNHTVVMSQVCDDSISLVVDPVRFEQVLVNILNNAAKYTEVGGRIEIQYSIQNDQIEIKIKDNGYGIEKNNLENVFMRFWQLKHSGNPHVNGGIGVGLSLTRHIVEMHGGTIRAESEGVGQGSTFVILMPYIDVNQSVKKIELISNDIEFTPFKVLIVDDNQAAADAMGKLLTLKKYKTAVAYTGLDALRQVSSFEPDLILLDIGLPDIDGFELAKRLRANNFKNKIAALSGYGQTEDIKKALASGCDHHFKKPMSSDIFDAYVRNIRRSKNNSSRTPLK